MVKLITNLEGKVNEARVFSVLRSEWPTIASSEIVKIHPGIGKWVGETASGIILRFPTDPETAKAMELERWALQNIYGNTGIETPRILFVGRETAFDGYQKISGEFLTLDLWHSLDQGSKAALAGQLGNWMARFHQCLSVEDARRQGAGQSRWPLSPEQMEKTLDTLSLEKSLRSFSNESLVRYRELSSRPSELRVLHNDLGGHNLAVDGSTGKLCGVYDFSEIAIADLHQEFQYLPGYEPEALELSSREYQIESGVVLDPRSLLIRHFACLISQVTWAALYNDPGDVQKKISWLSQACERYAD